MKGKIVIIPAGVMGAGYNGKLSTWVINTLCITHVDNFLHVVFRG